MKYTSRLIKNIVGVAFVLSFIDTSYSYNMTAKDTQTIRYVGNKLIEKIDERGLETLNIILDKIDNVQSIIQDTRLFSMYTLIEWNLAQNYDLEMYGVVRSDTPLLKTSNFKGQFGGADGTTLNFDKFGEIDAIEHIALLGSVVRIEKILDDSIYNIQTNEYPVKNDIFIHSSFIRDISYKKPNDRVKNLPGRGEIILNLQSTVGADYVWGGNTLDGIPSLLDIFPPAIEISQKKKTERTLSGLDCSGLIYYASNGYTPRNTSWLVDYGTRLEIAGNSKEQIISQLKPLDIIVWKGHMMIVLNENQTIESAVSYTNSNLTPGVQIREIKESLGEVMQTRRASNSYRETDGKEFVIIRWYPET